MTITAEQMLERAKALAGAACAATGTKNYDESDLSLNMNISVGHQGAEICWSIYIGNISTDGGHRTAEAALDALEDKINRMQAGAG
jgi:hypothetical protein